jgi:hypothetical protein
MEDTINSIAPGEVYYQGNSTNKSFLRMYKFLKERGIVNNKFFLAIYDKELINVDPYSPNLSKQLKARILKECRINPWYFLREVMNMPVTGGFSRYEMNRGNLALTFLVLNNINVTMMLPRQNGKTIGTVAIYQWLYWLASTNSEFIFSNKVYGDAQANLKRFSLMAECLPPYLRVEKLKKDKDNILAFSSGKIGNSIRLIPSATSTEDADKLGRGMTAPYEWFDEFAYSAFNYVIFPAAAPAAGKASEEAELRNGFYSKIITTTPNSIDLPEGQYCKSIMDMAAVFNEKIFYDLESRESIRDYVSKNSDNDFVHVEFSWRQLGKNEAWYRKQCRDLQWDKLRIKREVDLEWTLSSDKSPFSEEELEEVSKYVIEDEDCYIIDSGYSGYKIVLTEVFDPFKKVLLSCDCSGGLSKDRSVMLVIDAEDGHVIGGFYSSRISGPAFARLIATTADKIFVNSIIVVERNNHGIVIIDILAEDNRAKSKLFYHYKDHADPDRENSVTTSHKRVYGIDTSPSSRDMMMNMLFKFVNEEPQTFRLKLILTELKTLERKRNGKIEATGSGSGTNTAHDDSIMAYLIGRYAMMLPSFSYFKHRNIIKKQDELPVNGETIRTIKTFSSEEMAKPRKQSLFSRILSSNYDYKEKK